MKEQDDLKALVDEMYNKKQIKRFSITHHSMTKKYAVWIEFPDGNATTFSVNNAEELKSEMAKALPVKKSWKCHICRYYLKNCDGCKKGFYNSMFIPCPDWKGPEFQPSDKDLCKALDRLLAESKQMYIPEESIHKGVDWMVHYILELFSYDKGLKLYDAIPKGYWIGRDEDSDAEAPIVFWQCSLCRNYIWRERRCRDGIDEGWTINNACSWFRHIEEAIKPDMFEYMMTMIYNEKMEAEVSYECVHYNMDKLMLYVVEHLGYFEFAEKVRDIELFGYMDAPF